MRIIMEQGTVKWLTTQRDLALSAARMAKMSSYTFRQLSRVAFKSLAEGQAVQFDAVKGPKGWQQRT